MAKKSDVQLTVTASTWLVKLGIVSSKAKAVKLIREGKVKINGEAVKTNVAYSEPLSMSAELD